MDKKELKGLKLEVHTGEFDGPEIAVLEDPTILWHRIKQFAKACQDLGAAHIADYNDDLSFYVEDYEEDCDTEGYKPWDGRTDTQQLVVGRWFFWWEGSIKNTDCRWDTDMGHVEKFLVEYAPLDELPLLINDIHDPENIALLRERLST